MLDIGNKEVYTPLEISRLLGVSLSTVQAYLSEGKIKSFTPGQRNRRVKRADLIDYLKERNLYVERDERYDVAYTRVSTQKQASRGDLQRQQEKINNLIVSLSPKSLQALSDVASGLNDNRKGLNLLLDKVMNDEVDRIFILYKDRLTRFGFRYLKKVCDKHSTTIIILSNGDNNKSIEQELAEDIISIIHSFSGKLYGMRKSVKEKVTKELGCS